MSELMDQTQKGPENIRALDDYNVVFKAEIL